MMHESNTGLAPSIDAMPPPKPEVVPQNRTTQRVNVGDAPLTSTPPPCGSAPEAYPFRTVTATMLEPAVSPEWKWNPLWGSSRLPSQSMIQSDASSDADRTARSFPPKSISRLPPPVKVPSASRMVSPAAAASTAAWMVGKSPEPSGATW
jgi:hypothetical protein